MKKAKRIWFSFLLNKDGEINYKKLALYILPLFILDFAIIIRMVSDDIWSAFGWENGVFESMTFAAYFVVAILSVIIVTKTKNKYEKILFAIIAFFTFFMAMEEISWGQGIFDQIYGAEWGKSIKSGNFQGETTLHNNHLLQSLLDPGFLVVGTVGCIMSFIHPYIKDKIGILKSIWPSRKYFTYFFVLFFVYFCSIFIRPLGINDWFTYMDRRELEVGEMLLSLVVLRIVLEKYLLVRKRKK